MESFINCTATSEWLIKWCRDRAMHLPIVATFLPAGIYLFQSERHERVYRELSLVARQASLQHWALPSLTPWPLFSRAESTGLGCLPCAGMRANPSGNGNNIKPPCLDDLSPHITVTHTLNNIIGYLPTAYIHELTHPHGDPMS